jgi:phosphate transport system protein
MESLRDDIVRMGDIVSTRLQKIVTALETDDRALANRIADSDSEINDLYLDLEQDCIDLLALQQPVASDLRFIAASFKIITDLERIGDLAANLATTIVSGDHDRFGDLGLSALATTAVEMLDDAMTAYAGGDADACFVVATHDDELDRQCADVTQQLIHALVSQTPGVSDPDPLLQSVTRVLVTVRDLERAGDHAVNIAARTLYMVENDDSLLY